MRSVFLALLLACFALPAYAGLCQTCEDPGDGGSGNPPPPPPGPAALKIAYAEINPDDGTIDIRLSNGAVFVIDEPLNKAWVSKGNYSAELSLSAVLLQWAGNNAAVANNMRNRIKAMAANPKRMAKLVPGNPLPGLMMGMPGGNSFNCYFSVYPCEIKPYDPTAAGGAWGPYTYGFVTDGASAGAPNTADYNYWKHHRDDACEDAHDGGIQMFTGVGGMVVACPYFETGVGAVACYVSLIGALDGFDKMTDNARVCEASYPGPGKW